MAPRSRSIALALLALALGCGGGAATAVSAPVAPVATAAPAPPPPAPRPTIEASTIVHAHPRCVVAVNVAAARAHPLAQTLRTMLAGMSPWLELGESFDPVRDTDWLIYTGPHFTSNPDGTFVMRTAASDEATERAVESLEQRLGGPDPGVAKVDGNPHAILRGEPHVLAFVPPGSAPRAKPKLLANDVAAPVPDGEYARASMRRPGALVPWIPETVYEVRARLVPAANDGVELVAEADCPFESDAIVVAKEVKRHIDEIAREPMVERLTHGALNGAEVSTEGKVARLRVPLTKEQARVLLELAETEIHGE